MPIGYLGGDSSKHSYLPLGIPARNKISICHAENTASFFIPLPPPSTHQQKWVEVKTAEQKYNVCT